MQKPSRQRSHSFDEDHDGEWWPPPLTEQDVAIRHRAKRLLQAIRQIPLVYYDIKAWENEHENVFTLFRQGCLDGAKSKILEAALYNNRQIEDAWLFLMEMRRRHRNRKKHVQECARVLGASYNWSIVLEGSRKILEALNDLPEEICTEILEDANAHDLLRSIYPNQRRRRRQDDWLTSPSSSPTNGWSDSDPSWRDATSGPDAWPSDAWPERTERTPNTNPGNPLTNPGSGPGGPAGNPGGNPFKFPDAPLGASTLPGAPGGSQPFAPPQRHAPGRDALHRGRFPSEKSFVRPDSNPFRKDLGGASGNPFAAPAAAPA